MARDPMTLEEFKVRFDEIKERGWIKSTRKGPTGIGHTLETLIDYHEDNIALPDLGEVELKSKRIGSDSLVTLFTYDRKCWKMKPLDAVRAYGTVDKDESKNGRLGMYFTLSPKPNGTGVYIDLTDEEARVVNSDGTLIGCWNLEILAQKFVQKFPGLLLVSAASKIEDAQEYFNFTTALVMKGTSASIWRERLVDGTVLLDLRLHDKGTRARNHGTGFRTDEDKLPLLFSSVEEL